MDKMTLSQAIEHLDDILKNKEWECEECKIEHIQLRNWLNELKACKDLEEQGKLLKLPCAVGSLVYEPYPFMDDGAWEVDIHKVRLEDLEKIGKTVFLTKEEAEAAMRSC